MTATWIRSGRRLLMGILFLTCSAAALGLEESADAAQNSGFIKAAIIYNLCRYIDWPDEELSRDTHFRIGVLNADDDTPAFRSLMGKSIRDRRIEITWVYDEADLAGCSVVYISRSQTMELPGLLARLAERRLLSIGESDGFAEAGGIIELTRRGKKTGFKINKGVADREGFRISSQLLKLATLVGEGG